MQIRKHYVETGSLNVFANWDKKEIIFKGKVYFASENEKYDNATLSNW